MENCNPRGSTGSLSTMCRRDFLATAGISVMALKMGALSATSSAFGDEYKPGLAAQRNQIDSFMAEHKLDALILMDPALGHIWSGWMKLEHRDFVFAERTMMFVFLKGQEPFIVYRNATISPHRKVDGVSDIYPCGLMLAEKTEVLVDELRRRGFKRGNIGVEMDLIPMLVGDGLRKAFPGSRFYDAAPFSCQLRARKSEFQINCIRKALDATERGMFAMLSKFKETLDSQDSIPVQEIYDLFRRTLLEQRVQLFDAEHWVDRGGSFRRGQLKIFDIVACYHGMLSDFCVPFVLDYKAPPELLERSEVGELAIQTIAAAIAPGMTGAEATAAAETSLRKALGKKYEAGGIIDLWVVHGLGLKIHEEPLIGHDYRHESRNHANEIIRYDPGIVVSVEIHTLMEQMYVMTADGFHRMGNMTARVHTFADVKT